VKGANTLAYYAAASATKENKSFVRFEVAVTSNWSPEEKLIFTFFPFSSEAISIRHFYRNISPIVPWRHDARQNDTRQNGV
jgi:hypothetical protein